MNPVLEKLRFWRTAFFAGCSWATKEHKHRKLVEWEWSKLYQALEKRTKQIELSYCDLGLQMLELDREHQLLKLRSPTQLNKEYENAVRAASLGRPDASPTAQFESKAGRELIGTVEALATSLAASFERAGMLTAPPRTPQAMLLEEIRNLFDGCGIHNWPVHAGRIADKSKRVQQLREFSGRQKWIDI